VPADKFGSRIDDDIRTEIKGPENIRRNRIIKNKHNAMFVRNCRNTFQVGYIQLRIADGFSVNSFSLRRNGSLQRLQIIGFNKVHLDAQAGKSVMKQRIGSTVEVVSGNNFIAGSGNIKQRERNGRLAAGHSQCTNATIEQCNSLFQHIRGGIHQPRIDIAEFSQPEKRSRVIGILKLVRCGLINGNGA